MQGVNLIPVQRRAMAVLSRRLRLWITLALIWAVALALVVAQFQWRQPATQKIAPDDITKARQRGEELKRTIAQKNALLAEAQMRLAARRVLSDRPDWSLLLAAVSRLLGPDNVLRDFKLAAASPVPVAATATPAKAGQNAKPAAPPPAAPAAFRVELSGIGRTQSAVSDFALRLEETKVFDRVKILRSNREPFLHGEGIGFSVECILGEGVQP